MLNTAGLGNGILPLDNFLCWKLKVACFALAIFNVATGLLDTLLEILDIVAQFSPAFEISGGFNSVWRMHVWEGWLACNLVMIIMHLAMVTFSLLYVWALKKWPTLYELYYTKIYMVLVILYMGVELGVTCYKYSWYGPNTFRLAYLVFCFLWWLSRFIICGIFVVILYSRIAEVNYEVTYGERKDLTMDELRSGLLTPRSGYSTPHLY